jgi:hypothetical protein
LPYLTPSTSDCSPLLLCFCQLLKHPQEAQAARQQTDGYELDRNHHFKVSMFDDFERYARVPEEYAAPEAKQYTPTVRGGGALLMSCLVWWGQDWLGGWWVGCSWLQQGRQMACVMRVVDVAHVA